MISKIDILVLGLLLCGTSCSLFEKTRIDKNDCIKKQLIGRKSLSVQKSSFYELDTINLNFNSSFYNNFRISQNPGFEFLFNEGTIQIYHYFVDSLTFSELKSKELDEISDSVNIVSNKLYSGQWFTDKDCQILYIHNLYVNEKDAKNTKKFNSSNDTLSFKMIKSHQINDSEYLKLIRLW